MLKTIEDGIYTYDIYKESVSKKKVGTKEFAEAVIKNLGQHPSILKHVNYDKNTALIIPIYQRKEAKNKTLVGIDVFVHWRGNNPDELAEIIKQLNSTDAELTMITNRGIKVWAEGFEETFCTDRWRCRFKVSHSSIPSTLIMCIFHPC